MAILSIHMYIRPSLMLLWYLRYSEIWYDRPLHTTTNGRPAHFGVFDDFFFVVFLIIFEKRSGSRTVRVKIDRVFIQLSANLSFLNKVNNKTLDYSFCMKLKLICSLTEIFFLQHVLVHRILYISNCAIPPDSLLPFRVHLLLLLAGQMLGCK